MIPDKKAAKITGVLFLAATAFYMLGNSLIESIVNDPDYLHVVYLQKNQVILGMLLELLNSAAIVGIAIVLFPILKKHNETIALGYVAFRVMEAIILIVGAISPLLLILLSKEYIEAGSPADSYFQTIGKLAIEWKDLAFQLAMIVLGLYSLLVCYLLFQSRIIPRSLSVLGFIGYASLLINALLWIFGYRSGMILFLPGALFEIILPIWLIVKGFNTFANADRR